MNVAPGQIAYTVERNVPASRTKDGPPDALIAFVLIKWPGGHTQTLAINEDFIQFEKEWDDPTGERVIEREVRIATAH